MEHPIRERVEDLARRREQALSPGSQRSIDRQHERGKMLARNNRAFQSVIPIAPESDPDEIYDRIWRRMETTYRWRRRQLDEGQIEIRCAHTLPDLDEAYADLPPEFDWMDLLEMKTEDSRFDDYRTLINLVE